MYQPCGVEKLQPVLLNGTGFCSNAAVKTDVVAGVGVGAGAGDVEPFEQPHSTSTIVVRAKRGRRVTVSYAVWRTGS